MKKYRYLIFAIAILLTTAVCLDIYTWIIISTDDSRSFEQVKEIYFNRFPEWFRNPELTTLLEVLLLSIAAFFFFSTRNEKYLKIGSRILFGLDLFLIAWLLFTLM